MKDISNNPEAFIVLSGKHFSLNLGTRKEYLPLPFIQWYFLIVKKDTTCHHAPIWIMYLSIPSILQKKVNTKEHIHSMVQTKYELQKISELWCLKYRKEGVESDREENQRVLLAAEDTF